MGTMSIHGCSFPLVQYVLNFVTIESHVNPLKHSTATSGTVPSYMYSIALHSS